MSRAPSSRVRDRGQAPSLRAEQLCLSDPWPLTPDPSRRGTLVRETRDGLTTDLVLDEQAALPRVLAAIRSDGQEELYAYGPEGLHAQRSITGTTDTLSYALLDAQGSLKHLTDTTGALTRTRMYDAWGNLRFTTGTGTSRLGSTGEWQDGSLVYLRARWYHTGLGTFTSRDTFQGVPDRPQSLHRYGYAANNPVMFVDPSGHFCMEVGQGYTFGTTCDHDSVLSDFADSDLAQFSAGFVGRGLEIGHGLGTSFTAEGRATMWRGVQALLHAPRESWQVLADETHGQYRLAAMGWWGLTHAPVCTLSMLSAKEWGSITFDVASAATGSKPLVKAPQQIELIGFRGVGISNKAFASEHGLIKAGHIGISLDGGKTIYGFHPSPQAIAALEKLQAVGDAPSVFDFLKQGGALVGQVQNDTGLFLRARELAELGARTGVYRQTITVSAQYYAKIAQQLKNLLENGTPYPSWYRFPEFDGSPMPPQCNNCAT